MSHNGLFHPIQFRNSRIREPKVGFDEICRRQG